MFVTIQEAASVGAGAGMLVISGQLSSVLKVNASVIQMD